MPGRIWPWYDRVATPPTEDFHVKAKSSVIVLGLAIPILLGVFFGSGVYTFVAANGTSYLSDKPAVCTNCHVMQENYDGWLHGSHHAVATCNDCHLPHDNVVHKFYVKAANGWHHSQAFTVGGYPDPIRIKPGNAAVLEANCVRCHAGLTGEITAHGTLGVPTDPARRADLFGCVRCHPGVGHGG
jgi:cytochrome c nitrite reductase small subunit